MHGARQRPTPPVDGGITLALAIITALLCWVAGFLWSPTTQLMPPPADDPAVEASR